METKHTKQAPAYERTQTLTLSALDVHEVRPGRYAITIPARELTEAEHNTLHNLYPKLGEQAYLLLAHEALLAALVSR